MSVNYVQTNTFYLAGSGVVIGAASIVLTSLTDIYGNVLTMTDFGSKGYGTLEPDTTNEEAFIFTGITANANSTYTLTGVSTVLAKSPYTESSGLVRGHVGGSKMVITDSAAFWNTFPNKNNDETISGQWTFNNTPVTPPAVSNASDTVKGITKLSVAPASATNPIAVGANDTAIFAPLSAQVPTGTLSPYAGRTAPTSWLLADGSAVSRSTYAALFAIVAPSGAVTITIATNVFAKTAHGLVAGDKVHFTTTGALPTGLSTNTDYYVIASGLTADAFKVALSPGGATVSLSGTQSGVHTVYASAWGKGDGSTTFNLPNLGSKVPLGLSASAPTETLAFEPAAVDTANDWITILDTVFPSQGQKIQLTTTGTLPAGLSLLTDYYVIRLTATTFALATSQANANAATPTKINITDQGTGVHTAVFTNRAHTVLGRAGGEETHGVSVAELAGHFHGGVWVAGSASSASTGQSSVGNTSATGGDTQHNNMQPFAVINYIIKT